MQKENILTRCLDKVVRRKAAPVPYRIILLRECSLRRILRTTCLCNREDGWVWRQVWMGVDLPSRRCCHCPHWCNDILLHARLTRAISEMARYRRGPISPSPTINQRGFQECSHRRGRPEVQMGISVRPLHRLQAVSPSLDPLHCFSLCVWPQIHDAINHQVDGLHFEPSSVDDHSPLRRRSCQCSVHEQDVGQSPVANAFCGWPVGNHASWLLHSGTSCTKHQESDPCLLYRSDTCLCR
jgi:hypothetical protein